MEKKYQVRDKFFFANPTTFKNWPYRNRLAIGVNLNDAWFRGQSVYRFMVKGILYEISKEKAMVLGQKFFFPHIGKMPHIIPLEEFTRLAEEKPVEIKPRQLSLL